MSWRRMYLWKASGGMEQDHQYLGRWKVNESVDMYKKLSFMPCTSCIFLCCTNLISLCCVLDIYVHMTYMLIYGLGYSSLWWCRWDNGPISEPPTETELMARACHYHHPEICYEFDMQKTEYSTMIPEGG